MHSEIPVFWAILKEHSSNKVMKEMGQYPYF